MFWYASTYGVATFYNRTAIWGYGMKDMLKLFPYLNMTFIENPKWRGVPTKAVDYDPRVMQGKRCKRCAQNENFITIVAYSALLL